MMIKRVVLFKHGVAYFECEATVEDEARLELSFGKIDMDDLLKSLTIADLDGGRIQNISYDAILPVDDEIERLGFKLPGDDALSGIVENLRGIQIQFVSGGREITGSIAGLETVKRRLSSEVLTEDLRVVISSDGKILHFNLWELPEFKIVDEKASKDFQRMIELQAYWKRREMKRVTVFTEGKGKRRIHFSYAIATPVWKTSYRIVMHDDHCFVQCWALVDNRQDEDWDGVNLTLVAGMPISFTHDLYNARYKKRPHVPVSGEYEYGPPVFQKLKKRHQPEGDFAGQQQLMREAALRAAPEGAADYAVAGGVRAGGEEIDALLSAVDVGERSPGTTRGISITNAIADARKTKIGKSAAADLYSYTVETPITVQSGKSALVPILAQRFDGSRVAIYNAAIRKDNPLTAVLFKNATELFLEGGPVTVFSDDSYLGEGMANAIPPGTEAIIPFAVELACEIMIDHTSKSEHVFHCVIRNGLLRFDRKVGRTTKYIINNSHN